MVSIETISNASEVIGALMAAGSVVGLIWRGIKLKIVAPAKKWLAKVDRVLYEFQPNGGSSLVDNMKRISQKVDETALRIRIIQDTQPVAIYECDAEGFCSYANVAAAELFGLEEEQMLGNGWLEAISPDDRKRVFDNWHDAVTRRIPYEDHYVVTNHRNQHHVRCRTKAREMVDSSGAVLGYHGTIEPTHEESA